MERERLLRYASWIRVFTTNAARCVAWGDLEALQLYSPDVPLCPNVQSLDWLSTAPALRFLPLFVPPGIRSLSVSIPSSYRDWDPYAGIASQVLAEIVPRLDGSTLTKLRLPSVDDPLSLTPHVRLQISSLVLRCGPALTSLTPVIPLSEPAILHVMTLPGLRQLKIHSQPPPNVPEPMVILPFLQTLHLSGAFQSQWLSLLNSEHNNISPTTMISGSKTPHSTLQTLILSAREGLGPATINQVLTFTHLTTLNIRGLCVSPWNGTCAFNLTDRDITHLAIALPRLTDLLLGSVLCGRNTCKTTLRSFMSLSVHCSDLSYLQTHINTGDILRDVETLLGTEDPEVRDLRSRGRCGLESLDVGSTPLVLSSSSLELVAKGLLNVFPMLKEIFTGARHDGWSKVQGLVLGTINNAY